MQSFQLKTKFETLNNTTISPFNYASSFLTQELLEINFNMQLTTDQHQPPTSGFLHDN